MVVTDQRLPRITVRDPLGVPLDTDTKFQRAIHAAKHGDGQYEWRLPHAPLPARPDYSRTKPTTDTRVKHRKVKRIGGESLQTILVSVKLDC